MSAIAKRTDIKTSIDMDESLDQRTLVAAVDIGCGDMISIDANGKWKLALATTAANSRFVHQATRKVRAGESLTGVRNGVTHTHDLSGLAYGAPVFLSDTAGGLDTAAGTVSVVVGCVEPVWAVPLGTAADKVLKLACPMPTA